MSTKAWREANRDHKLQYQKDWYQKNKGRVLEYIRRHKAKIRDYVWKRKKSLHCRCGETHPACLVFHHPDPNQKDVCVADMVKRSLSIERIEREIKKCKVMCSNCHLKLHYRLRKKIE